MCAEHVATRLQKPLHKKLSARVRGKRTESECRQTSPVLLTAETEGKPTDTTERAPPLGLTVYLQQSLMSHQLAEETAFQGPAPESQSRAKRVNLELVGNKPVTIAWRPCPSPLQHCPEAWTLTRTHIHASRGVSLATAKAAGGRPPSPGLCHSRGDCTNSALKNVSVMRPVLITAPPAPACPPAPVSFQ